MRDWFRYSRRRHHRKQRYISRPEHLARRRKLEENKMKDWKTTLAGVATILGALCAAVVNVHDKQPVNMPVLFASLTAGVGLIKAADSK
jgi:hypothetical protein